MNFFILGEFPELPENFRIPNYPRMRTSYEYIMRAMGRRKVADNKLKILSKYALNAAIVEKSPCI